MFLLKKKTSSTENVDQALEKKDYYPVVHVANSLRSYQKQLVNKEIIETLGLHVSDETVRKAILKLGYVYKKKSLHASEQERPRCQGKEKELGQTHVGIRYKQSGLS